MFLMLMPRESEVIKRPVHGDDEPARLLRDIQNRIDKHGELVLPDELLLLAAKFAGRYRHPTAAAFAMLLRASERHS
jgi:hypothetical protein